jgi:diadenylate cyclase
MHDAAMRVFEVLRLRVPGITDVFDILIMWGIFYWILKAIYRTRAMQMAMGLMALFLIQILAVFFELTVLSKAIGSLFTIIPVAVIVLFQNEVRNALASLGRRSGIEFHVAGNSLTGFLDPIIQALIKFSEKKTGALLVIERRQSIKNYTETGIPLDAIPSYELLKTIFDHHSNLHDGATIVSNGRLASSGVVLPLTTQQNLPKFFGTRHRAALGMSEESDCVVLVVSEETGKIRFASGGAFSPSLEPSYKPLQAALLRLLDDEKSEEKLHWTKRIWYFLTFNRTHHNGKGGEA